MPRLHSSIAVLGSGNAAVQCNKVDGRVRSPPEEREVSSVAVALTDGDEEPGEQLGGPEPSQECEDPGNGDI